MTNSDALIGYTGFVGATLRGQHSFDGLFNSRNIAQVEGQSFNTVVCAAAPGSMFEANKKPEQDQAKIEVLTEQLSRLKAQRFVLVSSIAVLADFAGGDDEGTTKFQEDLAYGRHRRILEKFCEQHFENCLIVRLPALFGHGLRKNFIFDLMNPVPTMLQEARLENLKKELEPTLAKLVNALYAPDAATGMLKLDREALNRCSERPALDATMTRIGFSAIQFHNRKTTYQYYDMERLWNDICIALEAGLSHIHLSTEPLEAARIHKRLTGIEMPETCARLHREDMQTRHAALWSRKGRYLDEADSVLDRLAAFYAGERATK